MTARTGNPERRRGGTRAEVDVLPKCINCNQDIGPAEEYEVEEDETGQLRVWHATRLYFDECADVVPMTLRQMGFCIEPSLPKGTGDLEWLAHVGTRECTAITQDAGIARNPAERQALIDHNVKCFILPGRSKNAWDLVRAFVTMWDKIRVESRFSGPFIWRFHDDSRPTRWEQLYPKDPGFAAMDLSRTPVGHLLNLFADIVHLHDEGWFTEAFVVGMHQNIRCELEARIQRDRSLAMEPSTEWQDALAEPVDLRSRAPGDSVALAKPFDTARRKQLVVSADTPTGEYQWIIPAHKAGDNLVGANEHCEARAYTFNAASIGFCRSGFGFRPEKRRDRRGRSRNAP